MTPKHLVRRAAVVVLLAAAGSLAHADPTEDFFVGVMRDNAGYVTGAVRRGVDPNVRDANGQTGLVIAMREENLKVAEALLASPAIDVDAANAAGETPLMLAAIKGRLEWCRRLLDRGAKVERPGWTPLHYAASGPEPKVLALLLDRGARIEAESPNRSTPLMMAARYGTEDSVKLLLDRGADVARRNDRGLAAADFAREAGREALARRLAAPAR